jgi:hypothetical protein
VTFFADLSDAYYHIAAETKAGSHTYSPEVDPGQDDIFGEIARRDIRQLPFDEFDIF